MRPYISREKYINRIKPFIDKQVIKILTGQRRVGKSYLLYQIMDYIKEKRAASHIIYINKESFEFDAIKTYKDLISYVDTLKRDDRNNYLFIDEIQDIDGFEKALRHYLQEGSMDIYCTGSNANLLSGELATYLSGRYIEFKVMSLSYTEFLKFHKLDESLPALKKYLLWGGLPFLKNMEPVDTVIYEYLKNIYSTIIYKDIISRYRIRNTYFLENLIYFLANNTGNIISAKKISDYLKSQQIKMSPQIVLDYINYLKQAYLIFQVKRQDISGKKVFEINEKYYFEDWGIKNAIVGFERFDIGKTLENVVFIHLLINEYNVHIGKINNKEIDFVAEKNGQKLYIQVAYLISDETVKEREFGNLALIKDHYPKIVVSLDEFAPANINGIRHIHARQFLSEYMG